MLSGAGHVAYPLSTGCIPLEYQKRTYYLSSIHNTTAVVTVNRFLRVKIITSKVHSALLADCILELQIMWPDFFQQAVLNEHQQSYQIQAKGHVKIRHLFVAQ